MNNSGWQFRSLILRLLESLLKLYPPRFRREFSAEIQEIVLSRMRKAMELGGMAWLSAVFQEIMGLVPAIVQECWHEFSFQKERAIVLEPHLQRESYMKTIEYIRWADPLLWKAILVDFLPPRLLSFTFIGVGIGLVPIRPKLEGTVFLLAMAVTLLLLWMGWFTPELVLYRFPDYPRCPLLEKSPPPMHCLFSYMHTHFDNRDYWLSAKSV